MGDGRTAPSAGQGRARTLPAAEPRGGLLRSCLAQFATGVTVVTFAGPTGPRGLTVNAFTSVSLDPPLVLVSIAKAAAAHEPLLGGAPFCVNVLSAEQEGLARRFAGVLSREVPRWAAPCEHGVPRLEGALAFLECTPWRAYEAGDHSLFLGEVVHFAHRRGAALVYLSHRFTTVGEVVHFAHRRGAALVYLSHRFTTVAEPELGVEYLI